MESAGNEDLSCHDPVLELLRQIPWSQLTTAHGDAGDVPDAVQGLLSADPAEVEQSYYRLDNNVVLQSDLYEAAAYLPPILFLALDRATPSGRVAIFDLIYEIGCGWASPDVRLRFELTPLGDWKPYGDGEAPTLMEACRSGVLARIERVQVALSDSEPRVRRTAADLIEQLEE